MMHRLPIRGVRLAAAALMLPVVMAAAGDGARPSTMPAASTTQPASPPADLPSPDSIQRAIRQLNHPIPARRRQAVELLAKWGPLAFEALGKATAGPDLESALLADDLLRDLGEVVLVGSRVRIEVDRARVRWDEPLTLTVHVENPTGGGILVPWSADSDGAAAQPAQDDAHQVGAMMDIADFLAVRGPAGEAIELRVDSIEQDSAVYRAVERRAGDHPPSHVVAPGVSARLVVPQFNRGWARFPMLARGKYTIWVEYQPNWNDPTWTAQGLGLVRSNTVEIEVTQGAAAEVQESRRPAKLLLREEQGRLVGELQNTWDREMWFNLNIAGAVETHGRLEWRVTSSEQDEPEPFELDGDATGPNFAADRLVRLGPGGKAVVTRAPMDVVRKHGPQSSSDRPAALTATLRYSHIPSSHMLRKALRERGRHDAVPSQLFNGSATSDSLTIGPAGK